MNWVVYALISTIGFAGIVLIIKKLTLLSIRSEILNLYFWALTALAFFVYTLIKKSELKIPNESLIWFALLAIVAFVTNLFSVYAIDAAPNPGYVRAIQTATIVIVTIASFFIFGSKIGVKEIVGILTILIGVYLIAGK